MADFEMSIGLRNARARQFVELMDAARQPGEALCYQGTTLLARCRCAKPFGKVVDGAVVFNPIQRGTGLERGRCNRVAFVDGDGTLVFSLRAGVEQAPVLLKGTDEVYVNQPFEIESGRLVEPGAAS